MPSAPGRFWLPLRCLGLGHLCGLCLACLVHGFWLSILVAVLPLTGCSRPDRPADRVQPLAAVAPDWFADKAAEAGLDFVHFNGMTGQLWYAEIIGAGVALFY